MEAAVLKNSLVVYQQDPAPEKGDSPESGRDDSEVSTYCKWEWVAGFYYPFH